LNSLYASGAIEVETWVAAQEKAKAAMDKALKPEATKEWEASLDRAVSQVGNAFETFFTDIISGSMSAEEAFAKMAQSIIAAIAKMVIEAAAAQIIKSLFGAGGGGLFSSGTAQADPRAVSFGAPFAAMAAPSAALLAAPAGGASYGYQGAAGGNSPWQVTVNNNAGAEVTTSTGDDGSLEITIDRVRKALSRDVQRGGNMFAGALERSYSLGRAGVG
jgi:hypothetical protein